MFKATAQSEQRRAVSRIVNDTGNTGGIDPSVFRPALEPEKTKWEALCTRKGALQKAASKLNAQIALAKRRHHYNERGQVSYDTVVRWEDDRRRVAAEISQIDSDLTNLRVDKALDARAERDRFVEVFVAVAKEKLAGPIYKELCRFTRERLKPEGE